MLLGNGLGRVHTASGAFTPYNTTTVTLSMSVVCGRVNSFEYSDSYIFRRLVVVLSAFPQ